MKDGKVNIPTKAGNTPIPEIRNAEVTLTYTIPALEADAQIKIDLAYTGFYASCQCHLSGQSSG